MSERILIVGTGLIGSSIGLGLRKAGDRIVAGCDADAASASAALDAGALDEIVSDIETGAAEADVVIIATPVGSILDSVASVARSARPGTVVTDVGSTKSTIVTEAEHILGDQRSFVGGHPMAGTEGEGAASARVDLFDGALWILTPTDATSSDAYRRINAMVMQLGARTLALEPAEHDRLVALVSHLPYAIATSLMSVATAEGDERIFRAAAGSFRDVTRTAGSSPRIWRDIFATNRDAVLREIDAFASSLAEFREAVATSDAAGLDAMVSRARDARMRFPAKGDRTPGEPVTLEIAIPDRAGVLATITTTFGEGAINIEDLWVEHTAVGGVLRVVVDGHETAARAADLLEAKGFRTSVLEDR